jgi:type III pantothenate kinase
MNLIIDIGNTRIKLATFLGNEIIDDVAASRDQETILMNYLEADRKHTKCIIASVSEIPGWLISYLTTTGIKPLLLNSSTPLPFTNNYLSKESLGYDRIAAVAGAVHLYPNKNVLIIDAGTAITYEIKTQHEGYLGGNISPGLAMRFRALHDYTSQLPLLESENTAECMGRDTKEAILNGVQNGLVYEIEGIIEELRNKYSDLIVILTGGDAPFFENKLKKTIFVVSNLTLLGLNIILQHNAEIQ